jgi:phage tail protein X
MKWSYTSIQGDSWDVLAFDIYGSEKLAYLLLRENPQYHELVYLPAGLTLTIPDTPVGKTNVPRPPWVR